MLVLQGEAAPDYLTLNGNLRTNEYLITTQLLLSIYNFTVKKPFDKVFNHNWIREKNYYTHKILENDALFDLILIQGSE